MSLHPIYQRIKRLQANLYKRLGFSEKNPAVLGGNTPPAHEPEMLLIGCVDARLDPTKDIGVKHGKALIYRNIAALVANKDSGAGGSVAAAMEFAVGHMKVKKIVVMGHTNCGGIRALIEGQHHHTDHIRTYLKPLEEVRKKAVDKGESIEEQARDMEKAAVTYSLNSLLSYPIIKEAVAEGRLELHGWLLDTGNKLIWEMNHKTGDFQPLGVK